MELNKYPHFDASHEIAASISPKVWVKGDVGRHRCREGEEQGQDVRHCQKLGGKSVEINF